MMFGSHLVVAAAGFAVYLRAVAGEPSAWPVDLALVAGFVVVMIGAALPDIDHPESTVGRRVKWISYPIRFIFGHRGITHSAIAVAGMMWLAIAQDNLWISWLALGYLLHLVGDYLTDSGIPLMYPLSRTRYKFLITGSTNGASEPIIVSLVVIAAGFFVFS
jgi:inner membrane protein